MDKISNFHFFSSVHLVELQHLQNLAARPISNVPRYSHIRPIPCSLHWLPVEFGIDFKILRITFKAIYDYAPVYLIDLIAREDKGDREGIPHTHPIP